MSTHASSSNHSDLKVLFEDLHFEAPREVGLIAQEALALWPHQFFEKTIDCRRLLAYETIDVFQRNLNANFSLLTRLAGARSFAEILELQATYSKQSSVGSDRPDGRIDKPIDPDSVRPSSGI